MASDPDPSSPDGAEELTKQAPRGTKGSGRPEGTDRVGGAGRVEDSGEPEDSGEAALKPTAMRGNEILYGYLVAAELIAVGIADLLVTHGKGAPAHPETTLSAIGVALSVGFLGLLQTRHRMIVAFGAVVSAYFVTIPRTPTSLSTAHLIALVIPVVYAILLTQRQRKATLKTVRARKDAPEGTGRAKPEPRSGGRRSRKTEKDLPAGPRASRRYTPPKAKRARR